MPHKKKAGAQIARRKTARRPIDGDVINPRCLIRENVSVAVDSLAAFRRAAEKLTRLPAGHTLREIDNQGLMDLIVLLGSEAAMLVDPGISDYRGLWKMHVGMMTEREQLLLKRSGLL